MIYPAYHTITSLYLSEGTVMVMPLSIKKSL